MYKLGSDGSVGKGVYAAEPGDPIGRRREPTSMGLSPTSTGALLGKCNSKKEEGEDVVSVSPWTSG